MNAYWKIEKRRKKKVYVSLYGMVDWDLGRFNASTLLLAKWVWIILTVSNSLVASLYKATYFRKIIY